MKTILIKTISLIALSLVIFFFTYYILIFRSPSILNIFAAYNALSVSSLADLEQLISIILSLSSLALSGMTITSLQMYLKLKEQEDEPLLVKIKLQLANILIIYIAILLLASILIVFESSYIAR